MKRKVPYFLPFSVTVLVVLILVMFSMYAEQKELGLFKKTPIPTPTPKTNFFPLGVEHTPTPAPQQQKQVVQPPQDTPTPKVALIDCTLSYGTYKVTQESCNDLKIRDARVQNYWESTKYPTATPWPTSTPWPTPTPWVYNYPNATPVPVVDQARCDQIRNEWYAVKSQIENGTYSSSAEMVVLLLSYQESYNNTYSSAGCSGYLN